MPKLGTWGQLGGLVLLLLWLPQGLAHRLTMSAWAAGDAVVGEVRLSSGEPAPAGTMVEVYGPDRDLLAETPLNATGQFHFTPTQRLTYTFRADLGAGHAAAVTLTPAELPELSEVTEPAAASAAAALPHSPDQIQADRLEAVIKTAVQREILPLRRDLERLQERTGWRDIIGGLGYVAGVFGLLFFLYGRRRPSG